MTTGALALLPISIMSVYALDGAVDYLFRHHVDTMFQRVERNQDISDLVSRANVNSYMTITQYTLLHTAARLGHVDNVRTLLHHGANPNMRNFVGTSPLHDAAGYGNADVIPQLCAYTYTDVDIQNDRGHTPLHYAAYWNNYEAVCELIKHNASNNICNYNRERPHDLAPRNSRIWSILQASMRTH